MGAGIDFETLLQIVRHIFEASDSTTVHPQRPRVRSRGHAAVRDGDPSGVGQWRCRESGPGVDSRVYAARRPSNEGVMLYATCPSPRIRRRVCRLGHRSIVRGRARLPDAPRRHRARRVRGPRIVVAVADSHRLRGTCHLGHLAHIERAAHSRRGRLASRLTPREPLTGRTRYRAAARTPLWPVDPLWLELRA